MPATTNTVWRMRPGGLDTNGGGYDATYLGGTDYSQQDSPLITCTDLSIDATTNTLATSSQIGFTSAHVGNVLNVRSGTGFTVQRVIITSVSGGVATCNSSLGTTGSSGGTATLGGACVISGSTPPSFFSAVRSGNIVYIRGDGTNVAGDFTSACQYNYTGSYFDFSASGGGGTYDLPVKWIGENGRPRISVASLLWYNANYYRFENIYISINAATFETLGIIYGINSLGKNCVFNLNGLSTAVLVNGTLIDCEVYGGTTISTTNPSVYALLPGNFSLPVMGNFFHGLPCGAINWSLPTVVINNIIYNCRGHGLQCNDNDQTYHSIIANNTIDGNSQAGISLAPTGNFGGEWSTSVYNNIVCNHSNSSYAGIYSNRSETAAYSGFSKLLADYNCLYNNTNNYRNCAAGGHDITVNPSFVNPGTDWTPTNTALLAGYPPSIINHPGSNSIWMGAIHPAASSVGSSSTTVINRRRKVR